MPPFLTKASKIRLRILAWYQIIGGIAGLLTVMWLMMRTDQVNGAIMLIFLLAITLYIFSIYCGRLLFNDKYLLGLKLSLINQVIQIPQIAVLGYAFWYVSGLMLTIGISAGSPGFSFNFHFFLTSTFQISIATEETQVILAVNLVAIYGVYFVRDLKNTISNEKRTFEQEQLNYQELPPPGEELTQGSEPTF